MITIDGLKKLGVNTDEGLSRCMGSEQFYIKLVNMIPDEQGFDKLKAATEAGDLQAGFEAAHALKGVLGNLSLTKMFDKCSEFTELLRAKTETDYAPLVDELLSMRDELKALRDN